MTLLLAAWLVPDESMSTRMVAGVIGGLAGIVLLVGPSALSGLGSEVTGKAAIVGATLCYAASTVYIRCFVNRPALEMATGSMLVGTLFMGSVVALAGADLASVQPTAASLGTILYLGLFSTACANLIYFHLVPRLGATRMAQVNFAVPVGGALLGVLRRLYLQELGEATSRLTQIKIVLVYRWIES